MEILKEIVKEPNLKLNLKLKATILRRTMGRGQDKKDNYNFVLGSYVKPHWEVY